ncbi:MAG: hypothetical protein AMXMBFR53_01870 [Gemmatimonadota bacterium]
MAINVRLTGGGERHDLDRPGWILRAPGVEGGVDLTRPLDRAPGTRSPEQSTPGLDEALARGGLSELATLEVRTDRVTPAAAEGGLRAPSTGGGAMELQVPALPDSGQIVLMVNESGALTWHFPADSHAWAEERRVPTRSGGEATVTFRIPNEVVPPEEGTDGTTRGLVQILGKKVLKVLIHPLTDPILKVAIPELAGAWEAHHRTSRIRWVTPDDYAEPRGTEVTSDDWAALAKGRTLLFIHGTFSTIHGGFQGLSRETMARLHDHYEGRVIGFDHPTLSRSPEQNAARLLSALPEGLEVDIVCHSRGGLVTRLLQQPSPFALPTQRLKVRRSVFGGVPNAGTILTDADHVVGMLDRLTTALNVLPTGLPGEILDGILLVVKVLGRGALDSLPGLLSMRPAGEFLGQLNDGGKSPGEYFAIAADYEPSDAGLRQLVKKAGDAAVDRVFGNLPNDLVVPQGGVYEENGGGDFPVPDDHLLLLGPERGVMHTNMFADPDVQRALVRWLTA